MWPAAQAGSMAAGQAARQRFGGGGASDIRRGGDALSNRVLSQAAVAAAPSASGGAGGGHRWRWRQRPAISPM